MSLEPSRGPRIESLDVLRGIAILGILFLNITVMGNSWQGIDTPTLWGWTPIDQVAWGTTELLLEGTQRGMLQLLFGATAVIMTGIAMRAPDAASPRWVYLRRNLWLIVFGAIDGTLLLWPGDILFDYGLAGLLLIPFVRFRPRTLLLIAAGVLMVISIQPFPEYLSFSALQSRAEAAAGTPTAARSAEDRRAIEEWREARVTVDPRRLETERRHRLGSYADNLEQATRFTIRGHTSPSYLLYLGESLATMMIGAALFKLGALQGKRSGRFYLGMLAAGYGVGFAINAAEIWYRLATDFIDTPLLYVTYQLGRIPTTLGHVALIHLILATKAGQRILSVFAAPGRMALSCYVLQTLICCWLLFPGFGLGLYGALSGAQLLLLAIPIGALQLLICPLWLRRFGTGPFEFLLRRLTKLRLRRSRRPISDAPPLAILNGNTNPERGGRT